MKGKVAVGLSGGVDSAVAAALLKDKGLRVTGVYLDCFGESGCGADKDRQDALNAALKLKIPFKALDFKKEYEQKVLKYFFSEYKKGRTPNPDILCNQVVKFGLFYRWAKKNGFDFMATGHYVKKRKAKSEKRRTTKAILAIPKDKNKDQTYFLYRLKQKQLDHLLFPLGDLIKTEVRKIAREKKLSVFNKKDSTGICFIGELNIRKFLKSRLGEKEGEVVDSKGRIAGKHPGHWFFTVGQRGGWELNSKFEARKSKLKGNQLPRLYVIGKNKKKNQIVVGTKREVMRKEIEIKDIHWQVNISNLSASPPASPARLAESKRAGGRTQTSNLFLRIRHRGELVKIKNEKLKMKNDRLKIKLEKPVFGAAPGQSAVIYKNHVVLGGGVII